MNVFTITVLILAAIGVLFSAFYFGVNFLVRRRIQSKYTRFGSDFTVAQNWQEVSGMKPEVRKGERQHVFLRVDGYEFDWHEDTLNISLPDGRIVGPEVQVVDSAGNIFDTEDSARFGDTIGLSVLPNGESRLSSDRQAVIIRVRSESPFHCRSIGWHTKRMK